MTMANQDRSVTVTLPSPLEIRIVRGFGVSRWSLYEAYTRPGLIRRWWSASRGDQTTAENELRVGGTYRYTTTLQDGAPFGMHGVYLVVVPGERLVFTEVIELDPPMESTVSVTFAEDDGATTLSLLVTHPNQQSRDRHYSPMLAEELKPLFDQLEHLASSV